MKRPRQSKWLGSKGKVKVKGHDGRSRCPGTEEPRRSGLFSKRLKGVEPTTFRLPRIEEALSS